MQLETASEWPVSLMAGVGPRVSDYEYAISIIRFDGLEPDLYFPKKNMIES